MARNFSIFIIYKFFFLLYKSYKKKWESGQKARKPPYLLGFLLATFIFKSGQMAKKSGQKPKILIKSLQIVNQKMSNGQEKVSNGQIFF